MNTDAKMGGLIQLPGNLESPRQAKASDWSVTGATGAAGEASGQNKLIKLTQNQEGPMHVQDSGDQTPSVWGKEGQFAVGVNKGEGSGQSDVKCSWSVDLKSGQISPNASEKY